MSDAKSQAERNVEYAREAAQEEADRQRKAEPAPALAPDEFLAWRSPRFGDGNPARMDHPLWHWLVRTRWSAWHANNAFNGPSPFDAGPMWCFDRFGMSETTLPDGRIVHIGGEHEDYYDPDFFIYNDVTVVGPDGSIAIHGYPRDAFAPTDFHSATLVGEEIFIIGCLGPRADRLVGTTPVYRLALDTWRIERVDTCGDAPGWIHDHDAELGADGHSIIVRGGQLWRGEQRSIRENIDAWSFDTRTGRWTRLSALDWQRWTMLRLDRQRNRLLDTRQALWDRDHGWPGMESYWRHEEPPALDELAVLYRLGPGMPEPEDGSDYNEYRILVDGVAIRFREESHAVHAIVEGRLAPERLAALRRHLLATLAKIDQAAWEIESD